MRTRGVRRGKSVPKTAFSRVFSRPTKAQNFEPHFTGLGLLVTQFPWRPNSRRRAALLAKPSLWVIAGCNRAADGMSRGRSPREQVGDRRLRDHQTAAEANRRQFACAHALVRRRSRDAQHPRRFVNRESQPFHFCHPHSRHSSSGTNLALDPLSARHHAGVEGRPSDRARDMQRLMDPGTIVSASIL